MSRQYLIQPSYFSSATYGYTQDSSQAFETAPADSSSQTKETDIMLTAKRLEAIMEFESQLCSQYQQELDGKTAEIEKLTKRESDLQATIDKQLESLSEVTGKATDTAKVEQRNRELHNRCEKLLAEMAEVKLRMKTLQKDLAAVREEKKTLTQFDPVRMKKNLHAGKRKLAELEAKVAESAPEDAPAAVAENVEAEKESAAA